MNSLRILVAVAAAAACMSTTLGDFVNNSQLDDDGSTIKHNNQYQDIHSGNLLHTFDTWGPDYLIKLEMGFDLKLGPKWANVFQFTATSNDGFPVKDHGDRIPAVYARRSGDEVELYVAMTNNDLIELPRDAKSNKSYWKYKIPFGKVHEVELQQKQSKFTFKLNGQVRWRADTKTKTFRNVKWYMSCPKEFWPSVDENVVIRDMTVTYN